VSQVDWSELAQQMGLLSVEDGANTERGGTTIGREAAARILGKDVLVSAVDHHLTYQPGWELARSFLMVLKPYVAMERCLAIFRTSEDADIKASAICLLKDVADRRVLEWMPEIASSPIPTVRYWSLGIIDQLLIMQNEIELSDALPIVTKLRNDPDLHVREHAEQILQMIKVEYP
jgi:hypothetical protein